MMLQYDFIKAYLVSKAKTDRGASLVEYALLVALIAVVCIVAITFLGNSASSQFNNVGSSIN
jgi:pilus assembly protein Flp/PilA